MRGALYLALLGVVQLALAITAARAGPFRAGAFAIDIAPETFPVLINGGFLEAKAGKVNDPLRARCLVLDDSATRLAIVVVDSCMVPRDLLDRVKGLAGERTGIAPERMLISATHTHSAPATMGALGCAADPAYVALLPGRLVEGIERAARNLAPARVGWATIDDFDHTHCRRWIRRPDKRIADPFGALTVRANMHPGYQNPDTVGPSGPVDPGLSVVSIQSPEGRPVAVLANYSMHYYGAPAVSADYYGRFATNLARLIGTEAADPPFVAMMSQGTSGDQQWMDYGQPSHPPGLDAYAEAVAQVAHQAYKTITYRSDVSLAMAETRLTLRRRVPDNDRLAWARSIVEKMGDRPPRNQPEVYAREALDLHDEPERELKLQAVRIGDLGIAAIPDEVYALTGLKIKAQSPLRFTFTIELANGSEGYIPPPEQHALGGYTTWPARTAALEVQAEPRIVETVLKLLEAVSGQPRRVPGEPIGDYPRAVLDAKPVAYWRLDEFQGPEARDASGRGRLARYEGGVAFALEGPQSFRFSGAGVINRAPHFAGGRLSARLPDPGPASTVELWFWNGLPNDARAVTGWLLSRGDGKGSEHLGLGGTRAKKGRLFLARGDSPDPSGTGTTEIVPKTWNHVAVVRDGAKVTVYLNGRTELASQAAPLPGDAEALSVGGREDHTASLEGKIDEVAVYDRALTADEIAAHVKASSPTPPGE